MKFIILNCSAFFQEWQQYTQQGVKENKNEEEPVLQKLHDIENNYQHQRNDVPTNFGARYLYFIEIRQFFICFDVILKT